MPGFTGRLGLRMLTLVSLVALGGCAFATPFRGPGFDSRTGVTIGTEDKVVVALTKAVLRGDRGKRSDFWTSVSRVEASLAEQEGFIGYSLRREFFGPTAWTMTAWLSEADLDAFVQSPVHQAAIEESSPALQATGFARFAVDRDDLPLAWDRALEILERDGRHYR